jgi:hypothetical protein
MENDDFEVQGEWWIPGKREYAAKGILRFSATDGGRLQLLGTLRAPLHGVAPVQKDGYMEVSVSQEAINRSGVYPRIHGLAHGGSYTLEDCVSIKSSSSLFSRQGSETISVNRILQGALFDKDEDLEATGVSFGLANLETWILDTGITELEYLREGDRPIPKRYPRYRLEARKKPDTSVRTSDKTKIRFSIGSA